MIRILPKAAAHRRTEKGRLLLGLSLSELQSTASLSIREYFFMHQQLAEQIKKMTRVLNWGLTGVASGAHKGIELCMDEEAGIPSESRL